MTRTSLPAIERLRANCVETPPPEGSQITSPCLSFRGAALPRGGHVRLRENGKKALAHRVAYEAKYGAIPEGMVVMHLCDNPACCNPDHLMLGTPKDNAHDAILKGRSKGSRKNALPNLINRVSLLQKSGKTPEKIAHEIGYDLTAVRSLLDFLEDDEELYEGTQASYGDDLADHQRLERLVYDQHTSTAILAIPESYGPPLPVHLECNFTTH